MAEALALAARDPELGRWLAEQQAFDAAMTRKLTAVEVPSDLRQAILAGHKGGGASVIAIGDRPWWRSPALAWAASIVIIFAAAVFMQQKTGHASQHLDLAEYRQAMFSRLDSPVTFDKKNSNPREIVRWLDTAERMPNVVLPAKLEGNRALGCKVFDWQGRKSALISFELLGERVVHMFVLDCATFTDCEANLGPTSRNKDEFSSMSWHRGHRTYLLISEDKEAIFTCLE